MIIDIILDRKDGAIDYDAEKHLKYIYDYATDAGMTELATAVEALTCGELGTEDPNPTEILLSVTYGAGLPAEKADAIEDALLTAVNALPFPADDIFRGTGDGTREYTALFTI